ncbi:hypothetical protein E2C01_025478 [Portunus trituberculatus]|uniref:Uncharacterized protein n=1 Tax=Portunus trituberculatus TaxID=210409 RepID=A0A5B7EDG5_PORTR|nr:hypothetical protein [Portunus trituberculatus]
MNNMSLRCYYLQQRHLNASTLQSSLGVTYQNATPSDLRSKHYAAAKRFVVQGKATHVVFFELVRNSSKQGMKRRSSCRYWLVFKRTGKEPEGLRHLVVVVVVVVVVAKAPPPSDVISFPSFACQVLCKRRASHRVSSCQP